MRRNQRVRDLGLILAVAFALVAAGCGDDGSPGPTPVYSVAVTPGTVEVLAGEQAEFSAVVGVAPEGTNLDPAVTWSVDEDAAGTVDAEGNYTAPTPGSADETRDVHVRATSTGHGVSGVGSVTLPSAAELTDRGWTAFTAKDWDTAMGWFLVALETAPGHGEAFLGRAWTRLRAIGESDATDEVVARTYEAIAREFALYLARDDSMEDARSGLILAYVGADHAPDIVVAEGETLLQRQPGYVFAHDTSYTASDVRWLVARAALDLGDYVKTAAHLDVLSPDHGLDPAAAAFPEQALALLTELQSQV